METDIIFLTNLPAFYKINLFNEVNKRQRVMAVFTGERGNNRNADFFRGDTQFAVRQLRGGTWRQCWQLLRLLRRTRHARLIVSGWDRPQMLFAALISPRRKNGCIVESSIYESRATGWRAWIKKLVLRRMSVVYPPGKMQTELVRALGYTGRVVEWGGCGLLRYQPQPAYEARSEVRKFLYVGRLSPEKNLPLLLEAFRTLPELQLTIIGFGPQETELKATATPNIRFLGAINNAELPAHYKAADIFILPSESEPWGLVVEEALNCGTPVIVSNRVGCNEDLVTAATGLVFHYNSTASLRKAILRMTIPSFYNRLRLGVSQLNFVERAQRQVAAFLSN